MRSCWVSFQCFTIQLKEIMPTRQSWGYVTGSWYFVLTVRPGQVAGVWRGIIITATGDLDTSRDWRGYHCDYYFLRTGDMYLNLASDLSPGPRNYCLVVCVKWPWSVVIKWGMWDVIPNILAGSTEEINHNIPDLTYLIWFLLLNKT